MKHLSFVLILLVFSGCYHIERDCTAYKTGSFKSSITIDNIEYVSTFVRLDTLQIETFENKIDSAKVRWINDCEMIFQTINPKSMAEKKDVHVKILSTTDSSYTFEYSYVGKTNKQKGIALKIN